MLDFLTSEWFITLAINGAKKAMRESADEAAEALKLENGFALENQLADINSTLIAANK